MAYLRGLKTAAAYLVFFALLLVGNRAAAQTPYYYTYPTRQAAQEACLAHKNGNPAATIKTPSTASYPNAWCASTVGNGTNSGGFAYQGYYGSGILLPTNTVHWFYYASNTCTGGGTYPPTGMCPPAQTPEACASQPVTYTTNQWTNGGTHCNPATGCMVVALNLGDGGEVALGPYTVSAGVGDVCQVSEVNTGITQCPTGFTSYAPIGWLQNECIPNGGDEDGDGIPNNTDTTPMQPGTTTTDTDGDGVPDSEDIAPNDPTNGDGTTASKADNVSTGGGSCDAPPVSTGDQIAAQIAYQTWATRCAVERLKNVTVAQGESGGTTGSGLTTGQASDLAAVKSNTAAGNGKLDSIIGNTGATASAVAALQLEDTSTPGAGRGDDGQPASGAAAGHGEETEYGAGGLDQTGMGLGSTCPVMPAIDVGGYTITPDTGLMCDFLTACGALVFLFASIGALRILGSSV